MNLAFNPALHWSGNYLVYMGGIVGFIRRDEHLWAGALTSWQFKVCSTDLDDVKAELKAAAEARLILGRSRGW